ncbi:MAG: hypothetical protein LR001_03645 [Clostridiales bacterium]|nr:hypothetical protein [Clostridiales bacterium]
MKIKWGILLVVLVVVFVFKYVGLNAENLDCRWAGGDDMTDLKSSELFLNG